MPAAISDLSLVDIRHNMGQDGKDPVREAAAQFEALFIQTLMKNMRDASLGEGLFDSEQQKLYQGMLDQQFAIKMASGEGIGLADMLYRQLSGGESTGTSMNDLEIGAPIRTPAETGFASLVSKASHASTVSPAPKVSQDLVGPPPAPAVEAKPPMKFDSPESFVRELWPHVKKVATQLGVEARSIMAQAALETGWGQKVPQSSDGKSSLNFFGIKADTRWKGESVTKPTLEYDGATMRPEKARFRVYETVADSVRDYFEFLTTNPRYDAVTDTDGSPEAFGRSLAEAGYATDPDYAAKISRVATSERMDQLMSELEGAEPLIGAAGAAASP